MIAQLLNRLTNTDPSELMSSQLFDESDFYDAFLKDLAKCQQEVILESPFATNKRVSLLLPMLEKLKNRGVRIIISTRDPEEHDNYLCDEARRSLSVLQHLGIHVIYTENCHRKLAILDRNILWEGSLNILSQCRSKEVMRRTKSTSLAWQMTRFVGL